MALLGLIIRRRGILHLHLLAPSLPFPQTIVHHPSLLTLSVTDNLRPKATLLMVELGMNESELAETINKCPRALTSSVERRILPRIKVQKEKKVT